MCQQQDGVRCWNKKVFKQLTSAFKRSNSTPAFGPIAVRDKLNLIQNAHHGARENMGDAATARRREDEERHNRPIVKAVKTKHSSVTTACGKATD